MTEMSLLVNKITKDCNSIRRTIIVIYVELSILFLAVIFGLGVKVGKVLNR